jgi:hypothetical protein
VLAGLWLGLLATLPAAAETLRLAYYHTEMNREGPGLLLRDLLEGDPRGEAAARLVAGTAPDVLVLGGFDYDATGAALEAFAAAIERAGHALPHRFALRPNTGRATGLDLDGDGRLGGPGDAQGYGRFAGEGGLAILSRHPVEDEAVQDLSALLWAEVPGSLFGPEPDASAAVQRLSTTAHWDVPVRAPGGVLRLLVFHATPPVFDGPEDRNGRRNADEIRLWQSYLDGRIAGFAPPAERFVILGTANLDPELGDGRREAMRALLADPRLQDAMPPGPTARFADPGPLRVDVLLPSADWRVTGAGLEWPPGGSAAGRHALLWADLAR